MKLADTQSPDVDLLILAGWGDWAYRDIPRRVLTDARLGVMPQKPEKIRAQVRKCQGCGIVLEIGRIKFCSRRCNDAVNSAAYQRKVHKSRPSYHAFRAGAQARRDGLVEAAMPRRPWWTPSMTDAWRKGWGEMDQALARKSA